MKKMSLLVSCGLVLAQVWTGEGWGMKPGDTGTIYDNVKVQQKKKLTVSSWRSASGPSSSEENTALQHYSGSLCEYGPPRFPPPSSYAEKPSHVAIVVEDQLSDSGNGSGAEHSPPLQLKMQEWFNKLDPNFQEHLEQKHPGVLGTIGTYFETMPSTHPLDSCQERNGHETVHSIEFHDTSILKTLHNLHESKETQKKIYGEDIARYKRLLKVQQKENSWLSCSSLKKIGVGIVGGVVIGGVGVACAIKYIPGCAEWFGFTSEAEDACEDRYSDLNTLYTSFSQTAFSVLPNLQNLLKSAETCLSGNQQASLQRAINTLSGISNNTLVL